jgi:site-specific recombinase XerD
MTKSSKGEFFVRIRDFIKVYLPKQRKLSENTIRSYRKALEQLLDFIKIKEHIPLSDITVEYITAENVNAYLSELENKGLNLSTVNQRLVAIRAFISYASMMDITVIANVKELENVPMRKTPSNTAIGYMTESAVTAVLSQPDISTEKGLRDRTLMMLMYDTGARVQEIVGITLGDLRLDNNPTVILHGKGNKSRIVPFTKNTANHLKLHMESSQKAIENAPDNPLFYSVLNGIIKPLSVRRVRDMIKDYVVAARKVCPQVPDNVHPHLFRHSRAMHLYQHGMDLTLVSQWLGHANLETTLVYAYADTEHKRAAIAKATSDGKKSPTNLKTDRFTVSDEETLKLLCGLK